MRARAGDVLWFGGTMNTVALERKPDPSGADGVVGAGRKDQLVSNALQLSGQSEDFWVKGVVGIGGNVRHGQWQEGDFGFVGRDGAGKAGHHFIVGVEGEQSGLRNSDNQPGNRRKFSRSLKVGQSEQAAHDKVGQAGV